MADVESEVVLRAPDLPAVRSRPSDPASLELEIERTRAELARTIDAIAHRVSPRQVAQRGVARIKGNAEHVVQAVTDLVGGTARPSPARPGERRGPEPAQAVSPVIIGVGAAVVVVAAVILWRRRRR
ncbi:DUF3618 domain-containing protein [Rhizohabitans arisaemae]|uniref:DUF3618 domain-containing protein n=1 Tax=Rhizohabitans arisaemae TaxID=2720610 RepID=UPI0024B1E158|nr:DUF3618 domain-containing protein [Rhizohabitans arisaemae]